MTVKELIEKLEQVEDKEQEVIDERWNLITEVLVTKYGVAIR